MDAYGVQDAQPFGLVHMGRQHIRNPPAHVWLKMCPAWILQFHSQFLRALCVGLLLEVLSILSNSQLWTPMESNMLNLMGTQRIRNPPAHVWLKMCPAWILQLHSSSQFLRARCVGLPLLGVSSIVDLHTCEQETNCSSDYKTSIVRFWGTIQTTEAWFWHFWCCQVDHVSILLLFLFKGHP